MGCCLKHYLFEDLFDINLSKIALYNKEAYEINNLFIKYAYFDQLLKKFHDIKMNSRRNSIRSNNQKESYKSNQIIPDIKCSLSYKTKKEQTFHMNLTEIELQSLVSSYLLIEKYENESFTYFNTIYKEIPYRLKYPIMKIIIVLLLSNPNSKHIDQILIENIKYYSKYSNQTHQTHNSNHSHQTHHSHKSLSLYTKDNTYNSFSKSQYDTNTIYDKIISKTDLYTLIKIYFLSITLIGYKVFINKFKEEGVLKEIRLLDNKEYYENIWESSVINDFTMDFIEKQTEGSITGYKIYDFIKNNCIYLLDKKEIRRNIHDFAIKRISSRMENSLKLRYDYKMYEECVV